MLILLPCPAIRQSCSRTRPLSSSDTAYQPYRKEAAMRDDGLNTSSAAALAEAKERYAARNTTSSRLYEEACKSLPGGNTRSVLFFDPYPLMFKRGAGCRLWAMDGHESIDSLGH